MRMADPMRMNRMAGGPGSVRPMKRGLPMKPPSRLDPMHVT